MTRRECFALLPPEWPQNLRPALERAIHSTGRKVVVLDDDPTGTQSVHNVPVLTEWSVESLQRELAGVIRAFYLLTNSRSFPLPAAQALNQDIARNLIAAASHLGHENWVSACTLVSRGDSTLRGHFPGETDALAEALGGFDAVLLIPFFEDGGRYTIHDIHYVAEGEMLVPAGETHFARDTAFGYQASNLRDWVEEKTCGKIPAAAVASISLDDLRRGGSARVAALLMRLTRGQVCVVNAASTRDLEVFTLGLLQAEAQGRHFLCRTASAFVPVRAGILPQPLLTRVSLPLDTTSSGLIVVGSHVTRSSEQLARLRSDHKVTGVEVVVEALLSNERAAQIQKAVAAVEAALGAHQDVVVYTSRRLHRGDSPEANLAIGQCVSEALISIVSLLGIRPRYLLAKGGITSSDLATRALGVRRAQVIGQILPGVPVWRLGQESRWPDLTYIVFPGNVGGVNALAELVSILRT